MASSLEENLKLFLPNFMKIEPKNDLLFQTCNCKIINKNIITQLINKCPICLNSFRKPVILIHCRHIFCQLCIKKWVQSHCNCPICRRPNNKYTTLSNLIYNN